MTRTGAVQIYAHSANAVFAERLAAALDAAGYEIVTGPFNQLAVDAVIVVWSGAAMGSARLLEAAREPLDCGVLVPVSIGMVEPPLGFRDLAPVNLGGWTGDTADARWRRVLDEIEAAAYAVRGPRQPEPGAEPAIAPVERERRAVLNERLSRARGYLARAGAAARATAKSAAPLFDGLRKLPRAPVAAGLVLTGALLIAGFLLITPNGDGAATVIASAPASPVPAETSEPPLLAAVQMAQASEPEASPAPQPRQEEAALPVPEPALLAQAEFAEDEEIIAEGDIDYPDSGGLPAEETWTAAQAEAPDTIASLIASSVSTEAGEDSAGDSPQADEQAAASLGEVFRDCPTCPEMAMIPAGSFVMGSPADEPARQPAEGPQVEVTIPRAFALGAKEVTFEQWDACVADGGCGAHASYDAGWGRGARPVVNVSWEDAQAYAEWLSKKTGRAYRLPSEEEWEYAARAGAKAPFPSGPLISTDQANFDGAHPYGGEPGEVRGRTTPAGAFAANPFGLYDMTGNVWEWVADCWSASHENAPEGGAPRGGACSQRVLKGGAWNTGGWRLRAGHRIGKAETAREYDNGFRVALDLG